MRPGVLLLVLSFVMVSCSKTEHVTEYQQVGTPRRNSETGGKNGGLDSGGGNTLNGKTLEQYIFHPEDLFPKISRLQHIFDQLEKEDLNLAGDFYHVVVDRRWYLVPMPLEVIPSPQIGVSFPTEQAARQTLERIIISSPIFSKMTEESKLYLYVHEMVMGVRLLEFVTDFDRCLDVAARAHFKSSPQYGQYPSIRHDCLRNFPIKPPEDLLAPGTLNSSDYTTIQYLTDYIIRNVDHLDKLELEAWLQKNKFRPKFY